jgi:hypothetical protein
MATKTKRELRVIANWVIGERLRILEVGSVASRTMLTALEDGKSPAEAYELAELAELVIGDNTQLWSLELRFLIDVV